MGPGRPGPWQQIVTLSHQRELRSIATGTRLWSQRDCGCIKARDRFPYSGRHGPAMRVLTEGDHGYACAQCQARRSLLMTRRSQRIAVMAVAGLAAAGLAACSSSSGSGSGGNTGTTNTSKPTFGGTLRLVAASGPDHIDTVPAYYTADYIMERAYARQLLTYPSKYDPTLTSPGWKGDTTPVPDIATEVPTTSNGGITDNNTVYTFHIKPG